MKTHNKDFVRCSICGGTKEIRGFGCVIKECHNCKGAGYTWNKRPANKEKPKAEEAPVTTRETLLKEPHTPSAAEEKPKTEEAPLKEKKKITKGAKDKKTASSSKKKSKATT